MARMVQDFWFEILRFRTGWPHCKIGHVFCLLDLPCALHI